jgi:aminopeptidase YwaD
VLAQIIQLADVIGPRVAGTNAAGAAAEYIAGQLEQSGYAVETAEFSFETAAVRISFVGVGSRTLDALALTGSSAGVVAGRAVFVGTADAASIEGLDLEGAIAVALRDQRRFDDKMTTVRDAGAAGLVVINTGRGTFNGTLGQEAPVPVVGVGSESGDVLIAAAAAPIEISIDAPESTVLTGRNVIARWAESGKCEVLIGGHYDTVAGDPGANDNSSGVAHVIELARAFAADGLDEGICFVAFDAEEFGLIGSGELAESLRAIGGLPMYMINLDVTGTGSEVEIIGADALVRRALDIAAGMGVPAAKSSLPPNTGSDHTSFGNLGVQVLFFTSGAFAEIHTPGDSTELIQEEQLARVGDLAFAVISSLLLEIASD